jgi:hypothetical protein
MSLSGHVHHFAPFISIYDPVIFYDESGPIREFFVILVSICQQAAPLSPRILWIAYSALHMYSDNKFCTRLFARICNGQTVTSLSHRCQVLCLRSVAAVALRPLTHIHNAISFTLYASSDFHHQAIILLSLSFKSDSCKL